MLGTFFLLQERRGTLLLTPFKQGWRLEKEQPPLHGLGSPPPRSRPARRLITTRGSALSPEDKPGTKPGEKIERENQDHQGDRGRRNLPITQQRQESAGRCLLSSPTGTFHLGNPPWQPTSAGDLQIPCARPAPTGWWEDFQQGWAGTALARSPLPLPGETLGRHAPEPQLKVPHALHQPGPWETASS